MAFYFFFWLSNRMNHRNGAMILAEYLQSHDPIPSHPDEVLQRPLPPMASRNEDQAPSPNNDQFHIRIRSDTDQVNRVLEILNR